MITNDSHVIRKEACPECRSIGNDRSGDNLAVYSDGHTYCFSVVTLVAVKKLHKLILILNAKLSYHLTL